MDKSIKELAERLSLLASGKEREQGNDRKAKTSVPSVHSGKTSKKKKDCKAKCSVVGCGKDSFGFFRGEPFCASCLRSVRLYVPDEE